MWKLEISKSGQQRGKYPPPSKKGNERNMKRVTRDLWEYNKGSNICAIRNPEGEDEEGRDWKSMQKIWQKDF